MEPILRAKVKKFEKMLLIKNDWHIGFYIRQKKVGVAFMMHLRFMGHQSYVLLCTETTLSNPPVVHF